MATELVDLKTGEITEKQTFTNEQVQLLKSTVCKDHTDEEFSVFLNVCKRVQLDPFAKQIYSIKYKGQMTTQTSIDGLRLIADRTGHYAPGKAPTFTYDKEGHLESATAYIMKLVGGQWFEVGATAIMKEYQNSFNQLWQKLPHAMLSKCAEANALRRAFPNETSGIYSKEEMDQDNENQKPTIQMPKAKVVGVIASQTQQPGTSIASTGEQTRELEEDNTENRIDWGEPPGIKEQPISERHIIEEKIEKAFGKGAKKITAKQRGMLFAVSKQANVPELVLKSYLKEHFNLEHTTDLTMSQFDELLDWIKRYAELNKA